MMRQPVAWIERNMDAAEFAEWEVFDAMYGLPDAYFVAGKVCETLARVMTGGNRNADSFIPFLRPPKRPQTADEQRAIVRERLAAARSRKD
jgi:hypothetical protein